MCVFPFAIKSPSRYSTYNPNNVSNGTETLTRMRASVLDAFRCGVVYSSSQRIDRQTVHSATASRCNTFRSTDRTILDVVSPTTIVPVSTQAGVQPPGVRIAPVHRATAISNRRRGCVRLEIAQNVQKIQGRGNFIGAPRRMASQSPQSVHGFGNGLD